MIEERTVSWSATLNPRSPQYDLWRQILGSDVVPLRSAKSFRADLGVPAKEEQVELYQLDVWSLSPGQRERLAQYVVEQFHFPREEVDRELEQRGFPIRADEVIVKISVLYPKPVTLEVERIAREHDVTHLGDSLSDREIQLSAREARFEFRRWLQRHPAERA